jgi:hypothetical protein
MCIRLGNKWNITYNMGVNRYYEVINRSTIDPIEIQQHYVNNDIYFDTLLNNIKDIDIPLWETTFYICGSIISSIIIIVIIYELTGKK